jgi:hypothetical protein
MKVIIQLQSKLLLQMDQDVEIGRALVFYCCLYDGRIERKDDFHDFWLIVYQLILSMGRDCSSQGYRNHTKLRAEPDSQWKLLS